MTDRTAGSVDLATDGPDPVPGKTSDASSDTPVDSGVKVSTAEASARATTVLPIGTEPEPSVAEPSDAEAAETATPTSEDVADPDKNALAAAKSGAGKADTAEPAAAEPALAESAPAESEAAPRPEAGQASRAARADEGAAVAEPKPKPAEPEPKPEPVPPRVNRGTRLAERYRLEHRLSQNGRSETWRAVDEKLRRAVGVHIVPAGGEHGRAVIAAARAAALMGDPRFVQVLDCAEQDGLIYVVKEWLPDADNLTKVFESAPLPPHEVYVLAGAVAQAMSVAHRAGLSHLRLTPENVLRMHTGQYKIVGLAVEAALYGHDTTDAARDDVRRLLGSCFGEP